ncbi:hypothetical protein O6H91_11G000500 [Diphasiastrum complanatum]|nr:hypothetical protein O6H91_11G000500 [Diphasiastrum complanatum]
MQLQQAFMHSQLSKQRLSPPEITHYPLVLFGDERYGQLSPNLVPSARMQETVEFHHKISEDKMNSTAYQEDDSDIPVDPVLGYISDMLMDEDMEDRRCMFVDSSAYRAMADELAGLLGDSSASSDPQLASHSFLVEGITSPSLEDCRPSVASLDIVKESSEGLYDEILRDPMTKEIADMIDSDSSAFREYPRRDIGSTTARKYFLMDNDSLNTRDYAWRENDLSFPINEYPLRGKCSVEEKKLSDSGIKKLQTEFVESCYLPQAKRPSPIDALSQLPAYAPENIKLASPASSFSSSICQEHSSPSSTISELNDGHGYGLPDLAKPYRANGREDLFKLLQKSVASHVGKGKQKEAEGRYSPLGRTRSQESKSFQERSGSRHNGKLQRAPSGRYLQQSPGLSSDGDGDSVRLKYTIGVRSSKKSSPSNEIQLWSVGEPIGEEETPHGEEEHEGVGGSSDVLSLLTRCAQAIAGNNIRQANEIVREIRKEATPFGYGKQRLAYYFMEALVARISGTGGCLYTALNNRRYSAAEMLKAYQLRIEKCPFIRISHFFSNQTIANACDGESRLHVVDYGILYGFQWPSLIQTLANRPGGPPRLRITGIDFPQPGIKPSERVEDTGRRLSEFAQSCGVPFEYHSLAVTKWEDIQPSSLFLRHDEVLAINCMFRLRNLLDETVMAESPRNKLLARIRSMQPKVFVEAEVNAGYNAPFSFMARFREALAHFDNVYDAIDSCVTRDHPDRRLLEQEIFGREILNVVACEGLERVERAEQYKHWQWRTQKSGFEMLPLDRNICNKSKLLMHQYHKDYNLAEDGGWLMVGWRGRFSRCMSAWKPALFS